MTEPGLAAPAAARTAPRDNPGRLPPSPPQRPTSRWMQRLAEHTSPTPTDSGATAGAAADDGDGDVARVEVDSQRSRPVGSGILLVLGLLWLAATMWAAHAAIAGNAVDAAIVISSAALALPGIIAASLLAGAAAGLAAAVRRATHRAVGRRALVGLAAGASCGVTAAGVILFAYGANSSVALLAITVGVAGLLGGAAAVLPPPVLAAAIAATLGVFVIGVTLNLFQSPLKSLLGAGDTVASQASAARLFSSAAAVVGGLVAGLVAFIYLRRRGPAQKWPSYLIAGSAAGLLALVAEGLTQLGGSRLLSLVGNLSTADRAVLDYLIEARMERALIVGFVGGITAMIAVGRTLRRPDESASTTDPDELSAPDA